MKSGSIRILAAILALAVIGACTPRSPAASQSRPAPDRPPNVVLILADDLGYGDVGVYGSGHLRTPHLDALAASGVRFTAGYVTAAVCSPARAALLTGRYQQRFGYEYNDHHQLGLPADERTLGERMQAAGYATGYVGKWHLGWAPEERPHRRGFDELFGIQDSGTLHVDQDRPGVESWAFGGKLPAERDKPVHRDDQPVEEDEYLADAWTREAVAFIDRHREEPFFLFLAYNQPHTPLQATAPYLERYAGIDDPATRIYAAMVSAVDDGVGAIVAELESHRLARDTLIVFLSDNGCTDYLGDHCSNGPFAGGKRSHQEGGVRVPFLLSWPAEIAAGAVYDQPVSALDLAPTILAAAGAGIAPRRAAAKPGAARPSGAGSAAGAASGGDPVAAATMEQSDVRVAGLAGDGELDGVDLLPYLRGERTGAPHPLLFWRTAPNRAVRDDRYKLWQVTLTTEERFERLNDPSARGKAARQPPPPLGRVTLLYDLAADPGETTNLAAEHPEIVERLVGALDEWEAGLAPPASPEVRRSAVRVHGEPVELVF